MGKLHRKKGIESRKRQEGRIYVTKGECHVLRREKQQNNTNISLIVFTSTLQVLLRKFFGK